MSNEAAWNNEYQDAQLISRSVRPQKDFLRFLAWMKRNHHLDLYADIQVLDLGCGVGRNTYYMADQYHAQSYGIDFAKEAIDIGKKLFTHPLLTLKHGDISKSFPCGDHSVDLILDITASNALSEKERASYLKEMKRVLKPGGWIYVRTLAKEGDSNAQNLIKQFPGKEYNTYIHPQLGFTERVFSGPDFKKLYGEYFDVVRMERKTGYQIFGKQRYKRNYWNVYLQNKY